MDFPSISELKARGTRKWTVYDDDVLPLWIAESDFPTAPPVKQAIQDMVDRETFGYTPAPKASGLNEALADFYSQRFGWRPNPRNVAWIGDVVRGLLLGVQYFTRPGTPVAVPAPSYPPLLDLPATAGREKYECDLTLESIEEAFRAGAGSILLANPYNPLGLVLDEEFLTGLVALADKYDARILADEIHAPMVLDEGARHIPVASLGDVAADRTITVTATSKAFNVAGLKCAQIIFSNARDRATFNSLTGVAKDGTGTLGVIAAEAAYRDGGAFLDAEIETLRRNRDFAVAALREKVPGIEVSSPAATYLLWLDFRGTKLGKTDYADRPAAWLVDNARVALNEGTTFGTGGAGHARLNFATSPEILADAIDRIAGAIAKL